MAVGIIEILIIGAVYISIVANNYEKWYKKDQKVLLVKIESLNNGMKDICNDIQRLKAQINQLKNLDSQLVDESTGYVTGLKILHQSIHELESLNTRTQNSCEEFNLEMQDSELDRIQKSSSKVHLLLTYVEKVFSYILSFFS